MDRHCGALCWKIHAAVSGTAAQAAAGDLSGGDYTLTAGFWYGDAPIAPPPAEGHTVYLPVVVR